MLDPTYLLYDLSLCVIFSSIAQKKKSSLAWSEDIVEVTTLGVQRESPETF